MDDAHPNAFSHIVVELLTIMAIVAVLTIYHCMGVRWFSRRPPDEPRAAPPLPEEGATGSVELSTSRLMPPPCTYGKGEGMVGWGESTCPVCLCDFKDGEQIRLLPECMHYYHAQCIDVWLRSHSSCPVCRTNTTPPQLSVSREPPPPPHFGTMPSLEG